MNKPFIVAELSANHNGSLDRAYQIVKAAKDAGADAIKLQTWDTMVLDDAYVLETGPWAGRRLVDLYAEAKTPWAWHKPLFEYAQRLGLVAFSTPFDRISLEFLEMLHCPIYKVASFEITDLPLIRAIAKTGKPMMISTGMATEAEISAACDEAIRLTTADVTLLQCTSAYPADASEANLATMQSMQLEIHFNVGISDHTPGIGVAVAAVALGASVVEKHLTLSRADGGPDASFSMEPDEFAQMVRACRQAAAAIGTVRYGPTSGEEPQLLLRRSLYVAKDMKKGDEITTSNVRSARPAKGVSPALLDLVLGTRIRRDVPRGAALTLDLIDEGSIP